MEFTIQVMDRRNNEWRDRKVVEADSDNEALKVYGIAGSRPYMGKAKSKSGKTFRAVLVS